MIFELVVTALILGGAYYLYDKDKRKRINRNAEASRSAPVAPPPAPAPDPVATEPAKPTPPKPESSHPEPVPSTRTQERSGHGVPFVLSEVVWPRYLNVSKWPETSVLSGVSISENRTNAKHSKSGEWPPYEEGGNSLDSSLWIFVEIEGVWYASTFEYLRPQQYTKGLGYRLIPTWTKQRPINTFDLRKGDKVQVMASGLARRSNVKNVKERSNFVEVTLK